MLYFFLALAAIAIVVMIRAAKIYKALHPAEPETGFTLTPDEIATARAFLRKHPAVDTHAHPGRTFVRGAKHLQGPFKVFKLLGTFEAKAIKGMEEGQLTCAVFNGVSDFPLLSPAGSTLQATRDYHAGEPWDIYTTQMANMRALGSKGLITLAYTADDIRAAHAKQKPCAMLAMEGGDFLETDITRLQTAYDDGMRAMTLTHYNDNTLGDIMTGEPLTRGLTAFGEQVVTEMNRLGILIDLTHASEKMAFAVAAVTTKPVALTHCHVNGPKLEYPRFISQELADAVVKTGGFIGAWPTGVGIETLGGFLDRIEDLIDMVGEDHVALGTDLDANYRPVFTTYSKIPLLVGGLLKRGHSEERVAKFIGGNFLRVLAEVQG